MYVCLFEVESNLTLSTNGRMTPNMHTHTYIHEYEYMAQQYIHPYTYMYIHEYEYSSTIHPYTYIHEYDQQAVIEDILN